MVDINVWIFIHSLNDISKLSQKSQTLSSHSNEKINKQRIQVIYDSTCAPSNKLSNEDFNILNKRKSVLRLKDMYNCNTPNCFQIFHDVF